MREDPRALAWTVLRRVDETAAFADAVLGNALAQASLERRDQALVTQLVYGTLAWRGFLDCAIATFSGRPANEIEGPIRSLLELGLFQLFKLDRVPSYAAVSQTVELAKSYRGGRASGLVNAVLRRAAADGEAGVCLPDRARDLSAYLAARYSHPPWLVQRWLAALGATETEALLQANNTPAPTVGRVNRCRTSRDDLVATLRERGVSCAPGSLAPDAVVLEGVSPAALPEFKHGALSFQSEASQLVALLLDPQPGETVLDACAGSGGKSTYLAELTQNQATIVAVDPHVQALRRLRDEAARLGSRGIMPVVADATHVPLRAGHRLARILLDAPCSGLGTLRQHPEIRWRRTPEDIAAAASLQRRLLAALLDYLRPGGVLVYATCSLLREENEAVVESVLSGRSDIEREDARAALPSSAHAAVDERGALWTLPHKTGTDGFYALRLRRR